MAVAATPSFAGQAADGQAVDPVALHDLQGGVEDMVAGEPGTGGPTAELLDLAPLPCNDVTGSGPVRQQARSGWSQPDGIATQTGGGETMSGDSPLHHHLGGLSRWRRSPPLSRLPAEQAPSPVRRLGQASTGCRSTISWAKTPAGTGTTTGGRPSWRRTGSSPRWSSPTPSPPSIPNRP